MLEQAGLQRLQRQWQQQQDRRQVRKQQICLLAWQQQRSGCLQPMQQKHRQGLTLQEQQQQEQELSLLIKNLSLILQHHLQVQL